MNIIQYAYLFGIKRYIKDIYNTNKCLGIDIMFKSTLKIEREIINSGMG